MQQIALSIEPGIQQQLDVVRQLHQDPSLTAARVVAEHRGAHEVMTADGPRWSQTTGGLRHRARSRLDLPAVGDWVALGRDGRIEAVLPRKSALVRKAAGQRLDAQVIAANVDWIFVVTSANAEFNPRRIERYLSAIAESGASPVLVLNKTDLCDDVDALIARLGAAGTALPVARVSATQRRGWEELAHYLKPQMTIALVGSSGVGKSTLANWLLNTEAQPTAPIREHDTRGRHTTTHRELLTLPTGAALIDTPGMRELSLWPEEADVSAAFGDVAEIATRCRFNDCQHRGQPGCAIELALQSGELDPARFAHYQKLLREELYQRERGSVAQRQATRREGKTRARALRPHKKPGVGPP